MDFDEARQHALRIRERYDELNLRERGRTWTPEEYMLGFVGDVGDLAKLVMAAAGTRAARHSPGSLEHELADCLWSVLVLADLHGVDLSAAFARTMAELDAAFEAAPESDTP